MPVILLLILASLGLALAFLAAFVWAVRAGQYEDTCTPSMRVLMDTGQEGPEASANRVRIRTPLQRGEQAPRKIERLCSTTKVPNTTMRDSN